MKIFHLLNLIAILRKYFWVFQKPTYFTILFTIILKYVWIIKSLYTVFKMHCIKVRKTKNKENYDM